MTNWLLIWISAGVAGWWIVGRTHHLPITTLPALVALVAYATGGLVSLFVAMLDRRVRGVGP